MTNTFVTGRKNIENKNKDTEMQTRYPKKYIFHWKNIREFVFSRELSSLLKRFLKYPHSKTQNFVNNFLITYLHYKSKLNVVGKMQFCFSFPGSCSEI